MRKFISGIAVSALLLSSTAAFSQAEGTTTTTTTVDQSVLKSGETADQYAARSGFWSPGVIAVTTALVGTVIVITVVSSGSSTHT